MPKYLTQPVFCHAKRVMRMPQIEIQSYSETYRDQIIQLTFKIAKEFNFPISPAAQPDLLDIPKFYQTGQGNFWIALVDQQVVGTTALIDIGKNQGAVRKVFVDAGYRGTEKGISNALLETLISWCKKSSMNKIYLGTREIFYAAQRFYEKNGFQEIAKEDLPKSFPVNEVDSKFYSYQF